jgi:hypothetical protein
LTGRWHSTDRILLYYMPSPSWLSVSLICSLIFLAVANGTQLHPRPLTMKKRLLCLYPD